MSVEKKRAVELSRAVESYLAASGLTELDGVIVRMHVTYDGKVMVALSPDAYRCEGCRSKGWVGRAVGRLATSCGGCERVWVESRARIGAAKARVTPALQAAFDVYWDGGPNGSYLTIAA